VTVMSTSWDPRTTYDHSEKELDLMKRRKTMREQMRAYWVKESTNPHTRQCGGHLFDPAYQRWQAAKATEHMFFKPTAKQFRLHLLGLFVPFYLMYKLASGEARFKEVQFQSGTVAYRDRDLSVDCYRP